MPLFLAIEYIFVSCFKLMFGLFLISSNIPVLSYYMFILNLYIPYSIKGRFSNTCNTIWYFYFFKTCTILKSFFTNLSNIPFSTIILLPMIYLLYFNTNLITYPTINLKIYKIIYSFYEHLNKPLLQT